MKKAIFIILILLLITSIFTVGCGKNNQQPVIGAVTKNASGTNVASSGPDQTPPTIASISAPNATSLVITFSELLNKQSAENTANYSIPGLTVVSATLSPDLKTVTLVTTPQGGGSSYSVQISGVQDIYGNSMGAGTSNSSGNFAPGNVTPTANAGPDQVVTPNNLAVLDGSGSFDGDSGDTLSYVWSIVSQPGGANVSLSSVTAVQPSFTAAVLGNYVFRLIVSDGKVTSNADTITVLIDTRPVANAGPDQQGTTNVLVTLNGAGSADADGDALVTYSWQVTTQPNTSAVTLNTTNPINPTFIPTVQGNYIIGLQVTDARGATSSIDSVSITVSGNSTPVANAGANTTIHVGALNTQLNGTGVDADGGSLTFRWSIVSTPNGSTIALSNVNVANPTFTSDVIGNYTFQLVVNDGIASSNPSTVIITAANTAPVVNAGNDNYLVTRNIDFSLSATATDADLDSLTYSWQVTTSPNGSIITPVAGAGTLTPTYKVDTAGEYVFSLSVFDGYVTANDTVIVYANTPPTIPVLTASTNGGGNVTKNVLTYLYGGNLVDPDGDTFISTSWSVVNQPSGSTITPTNTGTCNATFTPTKLGQYIFRLTVQDDPTHNLASKTSTRDLTVTVEYATSYAYAAQYSASVLSPYGIDGDANYLYFTAYGLSTPKVIRTNYSLSSPLPYSFATGNAEGQVSWLAGLAVYGTYFYLADMANLYVPVFNGATYTNNKVGTVTSNGDTYSNFNFLSPSDVEADNNYLYVMDNFNNKIKIYNRTLLNPSYPSINVGVNLNAICVDPTGNIYVTCTDGTIKKYDASTRGLLQSFNPGIGTSLYGIFVDEDGYIYVTSQNNDRIYKYSNAGGPIATISQPGGAYGELNNPIGLYVHSNGQIFVCDYGNNRIQKFVPQ